MEEGWSVNFTGCFLLTQDGTVVRANRTAATWLRYEPAEMEGVSFHTLMGGGGQFFLHSQILPMLALKGTLEEVYLRLKERDGTTVPVLANVGYASHEGQELIELSFFRIKQRGQLEDELLQAKKLAELGNDAKTKFLGMMSHELRTPLQLISLNNQLLLAEELGPLNPEQREALQASQEANRAVAVLIDDILNFARMEGGPVQVTLGPVSMENILSRAEVSVRHRLELAGLSFAKVQTPANITVRADPDRLQQVLINLLNNAIKFTPRDGRIMLSAGCDESHGIIAVTDTGCGIPERDLQRIFEPFVQLRTTIESSDKSGVGLGLAICRDLINAMSGRIHAESTVGRGSTFFVRLPLENPKSVH